MLTVPLDPHTDKYDFGFRRGAGMSTSKYSEAERQVGRTLSTNVFKDLLDRTQTDLGRGAH